MAGPEEKKVAHLPVTTQNLALSPVGGSIFLDMARFEQAKQVARMLCASTMVPEHFRGAEGMGNTMIALELAERMRVSPFMLMQKMYIVHGKPGLEAQIAIAMVNQSGRFTPLKYRFDGSGDDYGCTAYATEIRTGETLEGPKITLKMVKAEGWDQDKKTKIGGVQKSKWNTMPDVMFCYRAASYFKNRHCPEVTMGMYTREEMEDAIDLQETGPGAFGFEIPETRGVKSDFETTIIPQLDGEDPGEFVAAAAAKFHATEEQIMKSAIDEPASFIAGFRDWQAKRQPADPEPSDPTDSASLSAEGEGSAPSEETGKEKPASWKDRWTLFREEWINLRAAGYSTFVHKNKPRFAEAPEEIRKEAQEKWAKLYPETPWPTLANPEPEEKPPTLHDENGDWATNPVAWRSEAKRWLEKLGVEKYKNIMGGFGATDCMEVAAWDRVKVRKAWSEAAQ